MRSVTCKPDDIASWKKIKASGTSFAARQPNPPRTTRFVKMVELDIDDRGEADEVVQAATTVDQEAEVLVAEEGPYLQDFP